MPQLRASRRPLFFTFLACQLLLNATLSSAAVIRRERRQISTVSVTETTPYRTDAETVKPTTENEFEILGEKEADTEVATTVVSEKNASPAQVTRHFGDEWRDDEYEADDEEEGRPATETTVKTKGIEEVTNEAVREGDTRSLDIQMSTANTADPEVEGTTASSRAVLTTNEGTMPTTSPPESESTPRVTFDSTTFSETGLADDVTEFKPTSEDVALSTHQPQTTDASRDSTQSATEEPGQPTEVISTTVVSRGNVEKSTDKIGSPDAEFSQTTTAGETTTDYITTDGSKFQTSTKLVEETTLLSKFKDDSTTSSSDDTTMMSTNEQSKPLTPTFKSDDPTMLFLTSTETFDEDGAQTTFEARPLIQEPSTSLDEKSSTPTSAEKRGKFIDDNYSYLNELRLSNTTDSWGSGKTGERSKSTELLNSVETSDEKAVNHSMATKTLLDWSRVMMSTDAMASHTTAKVTEHTNPTADAIATETSTTQETSTMKPVTTDVENLTNRIDSTAVAENEVVTNLPETTTAASSKETVPTTPDQHSVDDTSLPHTEDIFSTTALPEVGVTATATTIIETTTIKGETTHQPAVNSETTEDQNTGATSSVSIIDFTTPPPFLTQTTVTTTTTSAKTSTTPEIAFSMDDRTNETPDMASTHIPEHEATTVTLQQITTPTPTTSTTTPAVTVTAATTDETQKTETEARTPAIISDDTAQQSEARNSNNTTDNDDDNIYAEVSSETPTAATSTKSADSSSREAFEASTRVGPNWASASTANTRIHTAEVNSLDDPDESTVSSFETSNTYGDREPAASPTTTTTPAGGILKFVTDTHPIATATAATSKGTQPAEEDLERIDSIQKITDTGEASIESNVIDPLQAGEASTTTTTTSAPPPPPAPVPTATTQTTTSTTTTTSPTEKSEDNMRMPSTDRGWAAGDSSSTTTLPTTTSTAGPAYDDTTTPLQSISTKNEDLYSILPPIDSGGGFHVPKLNVDDTTSAMPGILTAGAGQPMDTTDGQETDVNVIIAISVSVVGIVALILLVAFLYVMRKRQKQMSYGQRCRPVSLDAYSLDNVSVYNSVRRKGAALRASKRSYGNVAFDDPSLRHNVLGTHELAKFVEKKSSIWDEFKDVPQIIARADEVPAGCEDKNRYANVIPLPETRVILQQQNGDEKTEYINANYVRGPKDTANYYIACQAPLETTVIDFWRMIWEQNSRVIIMATDLIENGIDKCAEYLPPSVTLDNHTVFGDFQVTLKNREVKEKYAISTLLLKNTATDESREITHYWYQWPETGVPTDEAAVIAMLLEARSSLKAYALEQSDTKIDTIITEESQTAKKEINGNVTSEKPKPPSKDQGPLTIHCSPGTGRTGTILAIDIAMRCLEEPKRCVDIPQIVYSVRRGRASAVQTKEQYEFIYKVTHVYATKISNLNSDN